MLSDMSRNLCFKCTKFRSNANGIGTSGSCTQYPNHNIPRKIYFDCGRCGYFTPPFDIPLPKKTASKKRKAVKKNGRRKK